MEQEGRTKQKIKSIAKLNPVSAEKAKRRSVVSRRFGGLKRTRPGWRGRAIEDVLTRRAGDVGVSGPENRPPSLDIEVVDAACRRKVSRSVRSRGVRGEGDLPSMYQLNMQSSKVSSSGRISKR